MAGLSRETLNGSLEMFFFSVTFISTLIVIFFLFCVLFVRRGGGKLNNEQKCN